MMLGKMIEEALAAEQKAAEVVAQAQKIAREKEHSFEIKAVSELKSIEEQARSLLHQAVEKARKDNEAIMKDELLQIHKQNDNFLKQNESLIAKATQGVCDILCRPAYEQAGGK